MGTRWVVINDDFGGFGLNQLTLKLVRSVHRCFRLIDPNFSDDDNSRDIKRDDPALVYAVQKLGKHHKPGTNHGNALDVYTCEDLKALQIPDDVEWVVMEYDGSEWIAEKHRTWE